MSLVGNEVDYESESYISSAQNYYETTLDINGASNLSSILGQNGSGDYALNSANKTTREYIGVDNYSVFTFMYAVSIGYPQALVSLTIVEISFDRSQAARTIMRPCSTDMTKRILRVWIIATITTVPRGFLYRYSPYMTTPVPVYKCGPVAIGPYGVINILYAIFHLTCVFLLPMCILICHIYSTVQKIVFLKSRHQSHANQHETHEAQNTQLHKKQLQLLRNSCIFAGLFLVCWLPWGIYQQLGDLPKSIVSPEFRQLIWLHFKTVRYLPFTVTAFLPFILVICSYDVRTAKCCGINDEGNTSPGANYRRQNGAQGGGGCAANNVRAGRLELGHNRPRPLRLLVNHVHHEHQVLDEGENAQQDDDNV